MPCAPSIVAVAPRHDEEAASGRAATDRRATVPGTGILARADLRADGAADRATPRLSGRPLPGPPTATIGCAPRHGGSREQAL
ncbi:hypothetical protein ACT4S5_14330 [Kocuria oceani]|uniref:hypothetical protein n=1 Tax=Kocuria oceani TaxID=988827 RepID=UPI0040373719